MTRKTIWAFWISLMGILRVIALGLVEVIVLHKDEIVLPSVSSAISVVVGAWLGRCMVREIFKRLHKRSLNFLIFFTIFMLVDEYIKEGGGDKRGREAHKRGCPHVWEVRPPKL